MDELSVVLKARALVKKVAPTTVRAPVEAYVKEVGAVLHLDDTLGSNEPGWTFQKNGQHHICVNANDREERQRFTICHEIAHIVTGLPSEHEAAPQWSYAKRSPNEILCDVFAAELLLPATIFKPMVEKSDVSLAAIDDLAEQFQASVMATGSRFAAVAGIPCAFVLAENGLIRYASRSTILRDSKAWIELRKALPRGSLSARLHAGGTCDEAEEVASDLWFSDWNRSGALLEDARHLAQWDQTIALLWFEDEELPPLVGEEPRWREVEEQGLAELDGDLPWPGRRRRR